ncbi:hypothetical protein F4779DRAFT_587135 [Xylariaceae sp. FL0662B]|nr:hypothetical protein F4779DRAFT_587135 [Xylariaceae sp. FL0662B]
MSHPQPTMPQRQFSPQHSPVPAPATGFVLPPNKRTKMSPGPSSRPASPHPNISYATSPGATTPGAPTPTTTLMSPASQHNSQPNPQPPSHSYTTSYQQPNGRSTSAGMTLTMPSGPQTSPSAASPQVPTPTSTHAPYSSATLALVNSTSTQPAPSAITNMGPPTLNPTGSFSSTGDPTRQASKPASSKIESYDMDDILRGTGIDLEEEAEYLNNLESRSGFAQYPPGGKDSFYGAGPANQPAQHTGARTQEELAAESADRAWNEAAKNLALSRSQEIGNVFLEPGVLHKRLGDVAQKFGLGLNLDVKPSGGGPYMGKFGNPTDFPKPELKVMVQKAPDGTVVQTLGSFLPKESYLVDQIALLSIGTKQCMRELLGDANKVATTRQTSSHGVVPPEWADAAAPQPGKMNGTHDENPRTGADSAVSPRSNPLKRSADELSNGLPTPVSEASPTNYLVEAMVEAGKVTRSAEEGRLKKRQKRVEKSAEKDKETADGASRTGSVGPGTPGSIAPEPEVKAPTKKEIKKAAAKQQEASSTTVNQTLGLFAGGKKKKYSWLNPGASASGTSTPRAQGAGGPSTPASAAGGSSKGATRGPLTKAGVSHLGQFREDSDKGKNIQLRDWIVVLEDRGYDTKSLQEAYSKMDKSAKITVENPS